MAAPYNNLRSKLARAIAAYLIAAEAGDAASVKPANVRTAKEFHDGVNTTVRVRAGRPDTKFTGNYRCLVHVIVRGSAATSIDEPDDEQARQKFDTRIAKTYDALMQSEDGFTLRYTADQVTAQGRALATVSPWEDAPVAYHADMGDFTCLSWEDGGFGDPNPNEQEHVWEEVLIFECVACGSAIS